MKEKFVSKRNQGHLDKTNLPGFSYLVGFSSGLSQAMNNKIGKNCLLHNQPSPTNRDARLYHIPLSS